MALTHSRDRLACARRRVGTSAARRNGDTQTREHRADRLIGLRRSARSLVALVVALAAILATAGGVAAIQQPPTTSAYPLTLAGAPTQPAPTVRVQSLGTLGATSVPLAVTWPAATPGAAPLHHYELQVSRDGRAYVALMLPKPLVRSVTVKLRAWSVIVFRVRAVDSASKASGWAASSPFWLETAQEGDRSVTLSSGWQIVSRTAAFGGRRAVTTQTRATATFSFTGREVAWVARLGPSGGPVTVAIDDQPPASLNLHRKRTTSRRVVFTALLPTNAAHTLTITTQTAGASYDVDAFVVRADPSTSTVVGAGDIASCTSVRDSATAAAAAAVPGIVFTAGDNVYPDGAASNYANCYDPSWGTLKDRTLPVPGNHDHENNPGAPGYFGYFGAAAGDAQKGWYKYDAGTWRVYALNSECTSTTCPQQYDWLKGALAAEPHLCTLAIWHRPRFSTGPHGNNPRLDDVWKLLYANGAEVVLNGHDHMFERYVPLDGAGTPKGNGLREFVVGTGGASLYAYKTVSDNIAVRNNDTYGVLRLDLSEGGYSWQFIAAANTGSFTDHGTAPCH